MPICQPHDEPSFIIIDIVPIFSNNFFQSFNINWKPIFSVTIKVFFHISTIFIVFDEGMLKLPQFMHIDSFLFEFSPDGFSWLIEHIIKG